MTTPKRLKFAVLMTACGLVVELAAISLISPGTLAKIPWLLQAAISLVFFYVIAPWATIRLGSFRSAKP